MKAAIISGLVFIINLTIASFCMLAFLNELHSEGGLGFLGILNLSFSVVLFWVSFLNITLRNLKRLIKEL